MNSNLEKIFQLLNAQSISPLNIEITCIENMYFVSAYNTLNSNFISESIASGADYNREVAILKSLVEYIERILSKENSAEFKKRGIIRTDGFAAYPRYLYNDKAEEICRKNAYHEAFERYCWANWWDENKIAFKIINPSELIVGNNLKFSNHIIKYFSIEKLFIVSPTTELTTSSVFIIIAKFKDCGFLSGGAAGLISESDSIVTRALSELTRHLLAFKKMQSTENCLENLSFYEKRLLNFASGTNNHLVWDRLNSNGGNKIILPKLNCDKIFSHRFSEAIVLHRCLFENQPLFIGGELNRLCL